MEGIRLRNFGKQREMGGGKEEGRRWGGWGGGGDPNGTKESVIKTGNGRREEGSGGSEKEAVWERRSGADTRAA